MSLGAHSAPDSSRIVVSSHANSWPRTTVKSVAVAPLLDEQDAVAQREDGEHSINPEEVAALERALALSDEYEDDSGAEGWQWYVVLAALYVFLLYMPGGEYNAFMTNMQQDFFAGQDCEGNSDTPVCSDANSKTTVINGIGDGFGAILALISSPVVGRMSDSYGRKTFIVIAALLIFLPSACISAYWLFGVNMWFFIIISNMASLLDPPFIMLAFLADVVPQRRRALAFGILISATQLPNCVGALVTTFCSWNTSLWIQLGAAAAGLILACLLPESLPASRRIHLPPSIWSQLNPIPLISVLLRYSMFRRLGLVVLLNSFAASGVGSVLSSYLIQNLDASTTLQSEFLLYYGGIGFLAGTVGMAVLTKCLSNRWILFLGCLITTAILPLLAIAGSHTSAYWLPLGLLGLSTLVFPAASALKSLNCSAHEQGKVQGALYGMLSIGTCLGETTMGFVFSAFIKRDSKLPYYPGAVMIYAIPFALVSTVLVLVTPSTISLEERATHEKIAEEEERKIIEEIEEVERKEEETRQREEYERSVRRSASSFNSRANAMKRPLLMEQSVSMSNSHSRDAAAGLKNLQTSAASIQASAVPVSPYHINPHFSYDGADESDESAASVVIQYAQNFGGPELR